MYQCPEFCREHQTYQAQYALADPSLKASRQEYEIALTFSIHAIFPCLVVQQISDMLAARLIVPKGPDQFMPRCCGRWRCLSKKTSHANDRMRRLLPTVSLPPDKGAQGKRSSGRTPCQAV